MTETRRRPARPRDAASLVLLRGPRDAPQVLLGRRPMSVRFMPGIYVFPGGSLERDDHAVDTPFDLRPDVLARVGRRCGAARARALAWTAIRETWEETGILLGRNSTAVARPANRRDCAAHDAFTRQGLAPDLSALDYIARAITPTRSPIRFNTRFFLASGEAVGEPAAETFELEDIRWRDLRAGLHDLPMMDVQHFVLEIAQDHWRDPPPSDPERPVLVRRYAYGRHWMRPERP